MRDKREAGGEAAALERGRAPKSAPGDPSLWRRKTKPSIARTGGDGQGRVGKGFKAPEGPLTFDPVTLNAEA